MNNWTTPPKTDKRVYEYGIYPDEERYEFRSVFTTDSTYWLAEEAAEDFFHNHDGWDCSWPLAFQVFADGVSIGVWSVDLEQRPHFSAIELVTS